MPNPKSKRGAAPELYLQIILIILNLHMYFGITYCSLNPERERGIEMMEGIETQTVGKKTKTEM